MLTLTFGNACRRTSHDTGVMPHGMGPVRCILPRGM